MDVRTSGSKQASERASGRTSERASEPCEPASAQTSKQVSTRASEHASKQASSERARERASTHRVVGGHAVRRHDGCKRAGVVAANLAEAVGRCRRERLRDGCGRRCRPRGVVPLRGEKRGGGRARGVRKRGSEADQREDAKEAEQVVGLWPREPAGGRAPGRGDRGRLDVDRRALNRKGREAGRVRAASGRGGRIRRR